jgi:hypothetical protein
MRTDVQLSDTQVLQGLKSSEGFRDVHSTEITGKKKKGNENVSEKFSVTVKTNEFFSLC